MKRTHTALITVLAISAVGCSISPERAAQLTEYDICRIYLDPRTTPDTRTVAENELNNRSTGCYNASYYGVDPAQIQAQQAAAAANSAALFGLGMQMMQYSQPVYRQPATTTCNQMGNFLNCTHR